MDAAGEALGIAVASLAMILNIDLFVIGGSVSKAGDVLLEPARRALSEHCYRSVGCTLGIVPAELGDDGPVLGCALLARQALHEQRRARFPDQLHDRRLTPPERATLEAVEGMVFDIQRFSLHDGPGVRTDVFLKGCAMRCPWCANPESQHLQPDLSLSSQRCINCNQFSQSCAACFDEAGFLPSAGNSDMGRRVEMCPTCAIRRIGQRMTAGAVMAEVLRDMPFYEHEGGMTLTGGEPTFQPRIAEALLRLAKDEQISTAIETSGHARWKTMERLLPYLDHILFDVKHMDPELHKAVTGVDNVLIQSNLRRLAALAAPLTIRVPLIPGFNASEDSLDAIARAVVGLDGPKRAVSLLPYHALGRAKYKALGREYPWESYERLSSQEVERFAEIFTAHGLAVAVGE